MIKRRDMRLGAACLSSAVNATRLPSPANSETHMPRPMVKTRANPMGNIAAHAQARLCGRVSKINMAAIMSMPIGKTMPSSRATRTNPPAMSVSTSKRNSNKYSMPTMAAMRRNKCRNVENRRTSKNHVTTKNSA